MADYAFSFAFAVDRFGGAVQLSTFRPSCISHQDYENTTHICWINDKLPFEWLCTRHQKQRRGQASGSCHYSDYVHKHRHGNAELFVGVRCQNQQLDDLDDQWHQYQRREGDEPVS